MKDKIKEYITKLEFDYWQEKLIAENPKGYERQDILQCKIINGVVNSVIKDLQKILQQN